MKEETKINKILDSINTANPSKYFNMTYEQGIEEALMWVVGDIPDDEFAAYNDIEY